MSKNLELKKQVVSNIVKKFEAAESVVIVKYSGLTVEQATSLREQFRANGVDYCVMKNTLVRRALADLSIQGLDDVLNGPSAFAFGMKDPISPAKIVSDFLVKTKSNVLEFKAGLLGNEFMDAMQLKALADLPSREVLLARLVGSIQSSIANFVRVLDAIAKKNGDSASEA